jgi:Holliday junction resolvase RusA-like endonuclease
MAGSWEEVIRETIPGQPVPKGRPRFYMRGKQPRVHTDAKTKAFEAMVARVLSTSTQTRGQPRPMCGDRAPVRVDIVAIFSRPVAMHARRYPDHLLPHACRPDLDNVCKAVLDGVGAANGLIWRDDGQVQCLRAESWYAEKGGIPRTEIAIYRWKS